MKTKDDVKSWLDEMGIKKYTINNDLTVDVDDDVKLIRKDLTEIPIQFNIVNGNFYSYINRLKSLKGSPKNVNKHFSCSSNRLSSLEYCPKVVKGNFYCGDNNFSSLEHLSVIYGVLYCDDKFKQTDEYKRWKLFSSLRK